MLDGAKKLNKPIPIPGQLRFFEVNQVIKETNKHIIIFDEHGMMHRLLLNRHVTFEEREKPNLQ